MAEIKFIPVSMTFTRVREIEEQCTVDINLPDYYSQATREKALYDHAVTHGTWQEKREMNVTGIAIVKGEMRGKSVCKNCGLRANECDCPEADR